MDQLREGKVASLSKNTVFFSVEAVFAPIMAAYLADCATVTCYSYVGSELHCTASGADRQLTGNIH